MSDPIADILADVVYEPTYENRLRVAKQIRQQIEAETVQRCIDAVKAEGKKGLKFRWSIYRYVRLDRIIKALEAQK